MAEGLIAQIVEVVVSFEEAEEGACLVSYLQNTCLWNLLPPAVLNERLVTVGIDETAATSRVLPFSAAWRMADFFIYSLTHKKILSVHYLCIDDIFLCTKKQKKTRGRE